MTGGQALVQQLLRNGIDTVFGLPGIQLDFVFDALWEERDRIRVIHTRHEQATAYMADGFARSTGRVGTCLVVPGPGLLNAAAGLATAYACGSRVLCLTGQIRSDQIGAGGGALHEIKDQLETISSVVKHAERVLSPEAIPGAVQRALAALHGGRPRPVELEVPPDVLERVADVTLVDPKLPGEGPALDLDLLEDAARLLGRAKRPLICCGGGVLSSGCWQALRELSRLLEAPVLMTDNGRGAVSDRDYHAQTGRLANRALVPGADAILAVGTRFSMMWSARFRSRVAADTHLIQVDIDPEEIGRNYPPEIGIAADAGQALGELCSRVPRHNRARESREEELDALAARSREQWARASPLCEYGLAVRAELPDDGILVNESTQVGYWNAGGGFPIYRPRTFLNYGYQGTLGYGFPTALGAQVGNPDRKVVSVNGDGGFLFNVQELSTMAQHRIPVVALVFDDRAYGNVRRIQQLRMGGHTIASDLQNPDWVKLAESFGVAGYRAEDPATLRAVLREAIRSEAPALIAVPMPDATDIRGFHPPEPIPPRPSLRCS
jgi:acetolactate synthase-1/2/3 large subunit